MCELVSAGAAPAVASASSISSSIPAVNSCSCASFHCPRSARLDAVDRIALAGPLEQPWVLMARGVVRRVVEGHPFHVPEQPFGPTVILAFNTIWIC